MKKFRKMKGYHPLEDQGSDLMFMVGAFDFETAGLGGELLCATWYVEGMFEAELIVGTPEEIIDGIIAIFVKHQGVRWYAHNAQYDWRYLIDRLLEEYEKTIEFLMRTDNDVFLIKTKDFELVDSMALWPHSLKSFAETFTPDLLKLDIGDEIANFDVKNPKHIEYAKRDSMVLVKAILKFDELINNLFGIHIAYTLAATAIKAWRATIDRSYFCPEKIDSFVREAYFGGAVQGRFGPTIYEHVYTYDINSSYPYSMREHGVPYGSYAQTKKIESDKLGIYRVILRTPDDLVFPIIPKRFVKGEANFIVWPQGTFETVCTNVELDFAQEQGYEVVEVLEGLVWNEIIYPFDKLINFCEQARKDHKGTVLEIVVKLIQNSVYGKFGTKKLRTTLFIPKKDEDYLNASPWGVSDKLWIKKEESKDILALPQWAVFITANARVNLLRRIYEIGTEHVIYCDTDSITTTKKMDEQYLGPEYGKFKLEKIWKTLRIAAPKVYSGQLENGDWTGAVKGLPKRKLKEDDYRKLQDEGRISADLEILPSFKTFMKGNRQIKKMVRESTNIAKSKSWHDNGGKIVPIILTRED